MKLGLFLMPSHPPERGLKAGQQWDLEVIRVRPTVWAIPRRGSASISPAPWEPNPGARSADRAGAHADQQIKLAPGAHLLPYHHPAELACRVAFMDHLAQGRYMLGIGASGLPSDWQLFCVDGVKGEDPRHDARSARYHAQDLGVRRRVRRVQGQVLGR